MSVGLAPNWRYTLTCHIPFFEKCSPTMRLLVLVHEAGHIALNHIPRLFKVMGNCTDPFVRTAVMATYNWAMDFAVNDCIVRLEPGFKDAHKARGTEKGEWPFLLPEEYGFPTGLSMEEYVLLLLKDLPKMRQRAERMLQDFAKQLEEMEPGEGEGEGEGGDNPGDGDIILSPFGRGRRGLPNSVPGLPESIIQEAINQPETFEMLQKAFDKLSGKAHKNWNKKAEQMTPEEAISAGSKMKKHAQSLARSANARVQRDRGFMGGNTRKVIDALLEPEQLPWDVFLSDVIQSAVSAKVQEEMVSPNLALINEDYMEPWPGQTLEFGFQITWFSDTSGSMGDAEYSRACACLNSLLAQNKHIQVTYVEGDANIQKEMKTNNVEPPDPVELEKLRTRHGYGGTVYAPVFKRILGVDEPRDWMQGAPRLDEAHPKPDLIVVCTDGGVVIENEVFPKYRPDCPIIWLVMPGCSPCAGMNNTSPDRVVEMFTMKEEE